MGKWIIPFSWMSTKVHTKIEISLQMKRDFYITT